MARGDPIRKQLWQFVLALFYFLPWSYKTEIRHSSKVGSLGYLSFSIGLLVCEIALEMLGPDRVVYHLGNIEIKIPQLSIIHIVLFGLSVLLLLRHHLHEAKKPGYEYRFVQGLADFMENRATAGASNDERIRTALELFHGVFERSGISHVSIHTPEADVLRIKPQHVFPADPGREFFVELRPKEGIAGWVYFDKMPRYLPRVSWLWGRVPFPHAVKFKLREVTGVPGAARRWELAGEEVQFHIFRPTTQRSPFRSFVSVPLKSAARGGVVGVLNFDFARWDPLDRSDIAMCLAFGLLLADEI